jgi:hypothetical protein
LAAKLRVAIPRHNLKSRDNADAMFRKPIDFDEVCRACEDETQ